MKSGLKINGQDITVLNVARMAFVILFGYKIGKFAADFTAECCQDTLEWAGKKVGALAAEKVRKKEEQEGESES